MTKFGSTLSSEEHAPRRTAGIDVAVGVTCSTVRIHPAVPAQAEAGAEPDVNPGTAVPGQLGQVLPTPAHFEHAASLATPDTIVAAGISHVYLHQIGDDQEGLCQGRVDGDRDRGPVTVKEVMAMDGHAADKSPVIDCAWCARCFENVLELLDHVEESRLAGFQEAA